MKHVSLLSQLATSHQNGGDAALLHKLQLIAGLVLNRTAISCALNTTPQTESRLTVEADRFLGRFFGGRHVEEVPVGIGGSSRGSGFSQLAEQKLHHVVAFPINFTAMSVPTVPFAHADYAPLR